MEEGSKFLIKFAYDPGEDTSKLLLQAGDVVEFLYGDSGDDWWYGRLADAEGWFPSSYGCEVEGDEVHVEQEKGEVIVTGDDKDITEEVVFIDAMFRNLQPPERNDSLRNLFDGMVNREQDFIGKVRLLIVQVIEPMSIRDTSFKRDFMQEYSLAVVFSVIQDLVTACSDFLQSLRQCFNTTSNLTIPSRVAKCFKDFSPTLRLFSQYTLEISNALNALNKFSKPLNQFLKKCALPNDLPMEQILVLPVGHYTSYLENFKKYVFTSGNPEWGNAVSSIEDYSLLSEALSTVSDYSREVDAAMDDEKEKQLLLTIQQRCKSEFLNVIVYSDD